MIIPLLPDWFFYALPIAGIIGFIIAFTIGKLFPMKYQIALKILSAGAFVIGLYMMGSIGNEKKWQLKVKEMEAKVAKQEVAAAEVTTEIITKYVDRIKIVEGKTHEIIKKVPVYITKESDDKCTINNGFVSLHDSSANKTEVPNTTRDINEGASNVKLSDIATTVSQNYGTYYQIAEQLKSLQEWVVKQKDLSND